MIENDIDIRLGDYYLSGCSDKSSEKATAADDIDIRLWDFYLSKEQPLF